MDFSFVRAEPWAILRVNDVRYPMANVQHDVLCSLVDGGGVWGEGGRRVNVDGWMSRRGCGGVGCAERGEEWDLGGWVIGDVFMDDDII